MKKTLSLVLAIIMLLSISLGMSVSAQAAVLPESGWCGDGVKFKFNGTTLTISGKGSIQSSAFEGQEAIKKVVIKKGVTKIGYQAFSYCANIKSVKIPGSVKAIDEEAFYNCTSLKRITVPGSVKTIDYEAFRNCSNLTTVKIKNGVEEIYEYAFNNCKKLKKVYLPKSIKCLGYDSFTYWTENNKINKTKITDIYYGGSKKDAKKIYYKWWDAYNSKHIKKHQKFRKYFHSSTTIHYNYSY